MPSTTSTHQKIYRRCLTTTSNATYLAESDQIVTLTAMETEDPSMLASIQDNLQELVNSVPEWEKETQSIHPKWIEHHQSRPSCQ